MSRCHSCPASAPRMMISLLLVLSLGLHTCNCKSSRLSEVFTGKGAARVVFIPASVASHYYQFRPIIRELAARGHQLQVVLTDEGVKRFGPGISDLSNVEIVGYNTSGVDELDLRQAVREEKRAVGFGSIKRTFGLPLHSHPLVQNTEVHDRIKAFKPDFAFTDLVLVGGQALADRLAIPKGIMYIPGLLEPILGHSYGSGGTLLSTVPVWMSLLPRRMNFIQRVQNLLGALMNFFVWCHIIENEMDKQYWQAVAPYSYLKSNRQASLVLVHADWAHTPPGPMAPHTLAIGAVTAAAAKPLPADLEEFVQSAGKHGVVFASLGTTAIPEPEEMREIAKGLSAIAPTRAIWKLSESDLVTLGGKESPAVGANVRIVKWVNQNDVLGHPNVKAFFTQGGTNSFNEASYHGVPMVGMPLFAEQPDNIARAVERGYALSVSVKKLHTLAADLEKALKRVLTEPSFASMAAGVSDIMKAHRQSPVQVAADAVEHAAWTKGSRYMQPLRDDLSWFQTNSLDVLAFLGCMALIVLSVAGVVFFILVRKGLQLLQRYGLLFHSKSA